MWLPAVPCRALPPSRTCSRDRGTRPRGCNAGVLPAAEDAAGSSISTGADFRRRSGELGSTRERVRSARGNGTPLSDSATSARSLSSNGCSLTSPRARDGVFPRHLDPRRGVRLSKSFISQTRSV